MLAYTAVEGDMLDALAWKHYGRCDRGFEAMLEANPHLLNTYRLAGGETVYLPELPAAPTTDTAIHLWR
nr:tail protein X [Acuticoccus kalidii]